MIESGFKGPGGEHDGVSAMLAEDPYVVHVVDHLERGVELEHDVEDWTAEMAAHLREKYDVDHSEALDAILQCHVNFMRMNGTEARAD